MYVIIDFMGFSVDRDIKCMSLEILWDFQLGGAYRTTLCRGRDPINPAAPSVPAPAWAHART